MRLHIQFGRAAVVSVVLNTLLYLLYLALTEFGVGYKTAMSLLYVVGVTQGFLFMKRWSFEHRGDSGRTFVRYLCAYAIGYSVNLATMVVLVDRAGYPHQAVQILNAVVFAGLFFLLLKFWVFSPAGHPTNRNV